MTDASLDIAGRERGLNMPRAMSKKANQTLQDLVTCAVCLETLRRPRMLPCQHTFCQQCLQSMTSGGRGLACPECRADITPPKDGVSAFPGNRYIQAFLELLALEEAAVDEPCRCALCFTLCDDGPCDHCHQTLCALCRTTHVDSLRSQLDVILGQLQASVDKLEQRNKDLQEKCKVIQTEIHRVAEDKIRRIKETELALCARLADVCSKESETVSMLQTQMMTSVQLVKTTATADYDDLPSDAERVALFMQVHHDSTELLMKLKQVGHWRIEFDDDKLEVMISKCAIPEPEELDVEASSDSVSPILSGPSNNQSDSRTSPDAHVKYYRTRSFSAKQRLGVGFLQRPAGVAVAPGTKELFVVSADTHRVHVFDSSGKCQRSFGTRGHGNGEFLCPFGIAFSPIEPKVYVTDKYKHCIHVFDREGNFLHQIGAKGSSPGHFRSPEGLAIDASGHIFVCDTCNDRIQVLDKDGTFIREFGGSSQSPTAGGRYSKRLLNEPTSVALTSDGRVVVCDYGNHRVRVFGKSGDQVSVIGGKGVLKGQLQYPEAVAVDARGFIVVGDSGNSRVQVFRRDGGYVRSFGTKGTRLGQFSWISGLTVSQDNEILVSDFKNHCVQLF